MEFNRNHYFLVGLIVLFLGIQLRIVDSYKLTPEFTQVLAKQTGHPLAAVNGATAAVTADQKPIAQKTVKPPEFLGWLLLSIGGVLAMHSFGMQRQE